MHRRPRQHAAHAVPRLAPIPAPEYRRAQEGEVQASKGSGRGGSRVPGEGRTLEPSPNREQPRGTCCDDGPHGAHPPSLPDTFVKLVLNIRQQTDAPALLAYPHAVPRGSLALPPPHTITALSSQTTMYAPAHATMHTSARRACLATNQPPTNH